jgi:hypothetical protein
MEELKELCDMENDKKMERASRVSACEDDDSEGESESDDESSCYVDTESEGGYSGEDESEDDESDDESEDDESEDDESEDDESENESENENDEDDAMSLDLDTNETIQPVRPRFDGIRVMLR